MTKGIPVNGVLGSIPTAVPRACAINHKQVLRGGPCRSDQRLNGAVVGGAGEGVGGEER